MLRELSRYSISDREAIILQSKEGYHVKMFEKKQLIHDISVALHTLRYAEDCAENWVHKHGSYRTST